MWIVVCLRRPLAEVELVRQFLVRRLRLARVVFTFLALFGFFALRRRLSDSQAFVN